MLPLTANGQCVFFAVLALSLCCHSGVADAAKRRQDLQRRKVNAEGFVHVRAGESVWRLTQATTK